MPLRGGHLWEPDGVGACRVRLKAHAALDPTVHGASCASEDANIGDRLAGRPCHPDSGTRPSYVHL